MGMRETLCVYICTYRRRWHLVLWKVIYVQWNRSARFPGLYLVSHVRDHRLPGPCVPRSAPDVKKRHQAEKDPCSWNVSFHPPKSQLKKKRTWN